MTLRIVTSLSCICLLFSWAFAQEINQKVLTIPISGKVANALTREPVAGAYYRETRGEVTSPARPFTDEQGNFQIEADRLSRLTIYQLGYIPKTITPGELSNGATVYLEPSYEQLGEVVVTGLESDRKLLETPASVGFLSSRDLQRFSNTSLVPALNTLPGVRMEERSPGSYRLNIRGSSIRSPYLVRNVKAYWNDIPFTDAGGTTPLNALDFSHIGRLEVIKGPAGSIYGAGTGGAILLYSPVAPTGESSVAASIQRGSYGLERENVQVQSGSDKTNILLSYSRQQSDGYREQSQMRRNALHLRSQYFVDEKRTISVQGLYSDLFYQTPGGLTIGQFRQNPRWARQATRVAPGAVEQQTAIYQKYFSLGVSQQYHWNDRLENVTSLYGSLNEFANPFITNYEQRTEQGFGGRTRFSYSIPAGQRTIRLVAGGEYQRGFTDGQNYGNRGGQRDTLQYDDEITSEQYLLFGQAEADLPYGFSLTAGASLNRLRYGFIRLSEVPATYQNRRFTPVVIPRIALLKKIGTQLAAYGSISYGFSPPSIAEVRPSEGTFNTALAPEKGTNYEVGFRGNLWQNRLGFDLTGYSLQLRETIVRRSTESGAEYFVNAGKTAQNGLELTATFDLIRQNDLSNASTWLQTFRLTGSYTYNGYRYRNYQQEEVDFSGKKVAGIAPHVAVLGIDAATRPGFFANITFNFVDFMPLNDANTEYANDYALLGGRLGYRRTLGRVEAELYAGVDNALNEQYSLGNDINAFGNRFYNPAPDRNYFGGASVRYKW